MISIDPQVAPSRAGSSQWAPARAVLAAPVHDDGLVATTARIQVALNRDRSFQWSATESWTSILGSHRPH